MAHIYGKVGPSEKAGEARKGHLGGFACDGPRAGHPRQGRGTDAVPAGTHFVMEFRITFHARTKESIAKLGINPVKLGFAFDTEKSTEISRENTEKSTENSGKNTEKSTENSGENTGGGPNKSGKPKRLTETEARIVSILGKQNNATQGYIATQLGVTRTYVTKIMGNLQTQGVIRRVGPDKGGHWEVIGGEP